MTFSYTSSFMFARAGEKGKIIIMNFNENIQICHKTEGIMSN